MSLLFDGTDTETLFFVLVTMLMLWQFLQKNENRSSLAKIIEVPQLLKRILRATLHCVVSGSIITGSRVSKLKQRLIEGTHNFQLTKCSVEIVVRRKT